MKIKVLDTKSYRKLSEELGANIVFQDLKLGKYYLRAISHLANTDTELFVHHSQLEWILEEEFKDSRKNDKS